MRSGGSELSLKTANALVPTVLVKRNVSGVRDRPSVLTEWLIHSGNHVRLAFGGEKAVLEEILRRWKGAVEEIGLNKTIE